MHILAIVGQIHKHFFITNIDRASALRNGAANDDLQQVSAVHLFFAHMNEYIYTYIKHTFADTCTNVNIYDEENEGTKSFN